MFDYLFPIFCLGCDGVEGKWLCESCRTALDVSGVFCCPLCHERTVRGQVCASCADASPLLAVAAAAPYRERTTIARIIHAVKYAYALPSAYLFDDAIHAFLSTAHRWFHASDSIVPVPLHPRRFAERGFNQADLIAGALGNAIGVPVCHALRRKRYTRQQTKMHREDRQKNMRGAFGVHPSSTVQGKRIILVDDVYTTGATMQECARALLAAGAKEVRGFVLARGEYLWRKG